MAHHFPSILVFSGVPVPANGNHLTALALDLDLRVLAVGLAPAFVLAVWAGEAVQGQRGGEVDLVAAAAGDLALALLQESAEGVPALPAVQPEQSPGPLWPLIRSLPPPAGVGVFSGLSGSSASLWRSHCPFMGQVPQS